LALKGPSGGITASADVNIWKAYLHYIRRQNPVGAGVADEEAKRRTITEAYEFALRQCGVDREAGEIWAEYIAFVQDVKVSWTAPNTR
jgi:cleavage stimulation factor subunit 3